jgi:DNA processing protein
MTMTASPTAIALLSLMKLKGFGRRAALKIVDKPIGETDLGGCREALVARVSRSPQARVSTTELLDAWAKSKEQLDQSQNAGVQAFSFYDAEYPRRLRKIPDPPAVLFLKGKTDGLYATRSLAVVGTREPTSYGEEVAQRSARTAVESGFVIVSGLAHGCDAYAHRGCIEVHGVGVAVLAHGLDKVYPAANRDLAERLLEEGGCLISEYPVGVTPVRSAFAERDRIQSGLSDAVLVIETDVKGGTMHTVRFARKQQRLLACIAHPERCLVEDKTKGNQKLIKDGWATPIPDGEALMRFLKDITPVASDETPGWPDDGTGERQRSWAF